MSGDLHWQLDPGRPVQLGLIVLQEDETLEDDLRRMRAAPDPSWIQEVFSEVKRRNADLSY